MLDEYFPIKPRDPESFQNELIKRIIGPLGVLPENFIAIDASRGAGLKKFRDRLKEVGPRTLTMLGIGLNGHIGFNEPGSSGDSRTRIVNLSRSTINANQIDRQLAVRRALRILRNLKELYLQPLAQVRAR